MIFDISTGQFSCYPSSGDIKSYSFVVYFSDEHYPTTSKTYYIAYIYIYPNRAPRITGSISNHSTVAGYAYSHTFSSTLFTEDDGEPMTYTIVTSPSQSWLSIDSATRTISGTPIPNINAQYYTIYVYANDNNTNSGSTYTYFYLNVTANQIPTIDQGLPSALNVIVHQPFSYTVPADAFKDPEGEAYTIRYALIPDNFTTTYDSVTRIVSGTPSDNSKYGSTTLRFYVEDIWNVSSYIRDVSFTVYKNNAPTIVTQPSNAS
jgi:hypothetical protein